MYIYISEITDRIYNAYPSLLFPASYYRYIDFCLPRIDSAA